MDSSGVNLELSGMKFQPETSEGVNLIARQEPGRVWVGTPAGVLAFEHSLLVPWSGDVLAWDAATPAELTPAHFERIAALRPEVVIFGSGARLQFVAPALQRALIELRIGVETMDTAAACRTYNVLASERRRALAALLVTPQV
jgi:uncharacterized protein